MVKIYPRVDLGYWLGLDESSFSAALARLQGLYLAVDEMIEATTKELDLPCARGCSQCCRESVFLTPLEFALVWEWVQDNFDDEQRSGFVERALFLYHRFSSLIEALEEPLGEGETDHFSVAEKIKFDCFFLDDLGACQVYPVRELYSRLFGTSFGDRGIYGCGLVQSHLEGKELSLLTARKVARHLDELPATGKRQVYPYYLFCLYGEMALNEVDA